MLYLGLPSKTDRGCALFVRIGHPTSMQYSHHPDLKLPNNAVHQSNRFIKNYCCAAEVLQKLPPFISVHNFTPEQEPRHRIKCRQIGPRDAISPRYPQRSSTRSSLVEPFNTLLCLSSLRTYDQYCFYLAADPTESN